MLSVTFVHENLYLYNVTAIPRQIQWHPDSLNLRGKQNLVPEIMSSRSIIWNTKHRVWSYFQIPRREFKIRRVAKYFRRTSMHSARLRAWWLGDVAQWSQTRLIWWVGYLFKCKFNCFRKQLSARNDGVNRMVAFHLLFVTVDPNKLALF